MSEARTGRFLTKGLRIQFIPTYIVEDVEVAFIPELRVPGFSHRVAVDRALTRSWLREDLKPSKEAAAFFYRKHVLGEK